MKKSFLYFLPLLLCSTNLAIATEVSRMDKQQRAVIMQIKASRGSSKPSDAALSYYIIKIAKKHGLKPSTFTAFLALESMFQLDAINEKSQDYGIGQINSRNIVALNLDKYKLITDLEYSLDASASIIAYFKQKKAKAEPQTWACRYNLGFKKYKDNHKLICTKYLKLLTKHGYEPI